MFVVLFFSPWFFLPCFSAVLSLCMFFFPVFFFSCSFPFLPSLFHFVLLLSETLALQGLFRIGVEYTRPAVVKQCRDLAYPQKNPQEDLFQQRPSYSGTGWLVGFPLTACSGACFFVGSRNEIDWFGLGPLYFGLQCWMPLIIGDIGYMFSCQETCQLVNSWFILPLYVLYMPFLLNHNIHSSLV